jgi:hypothetical protein
VKVKLDFFGAFIALSHTRFLFVKQQCIVACFARFGFFGSTTFEAASAGPYSCARSGDGDAVMQGANAHNHAP